MSRSPGASRRAAPVLVVAPEPFYADRGTPIAVRQAVEALLALDYPVDVLTYPVGAPLAHPGLTIYRAANPLGIRRVPIGLSARKLALDVSLVAALAGRLRRRRYACIHAVEEAAFPAVVLGRRHGVPVIYDMQSSLPEQLRRHRPLGAEPVQRVLHRCERWLVERADAVVASAGLAARLRDAVPGRRIREWRFSAAPRAVTADEVCALRRALALPADARVVLYAGTFEHYQGLDDLVAAMPAVLAEAPEAVFVLLGAEGGPSAPWRDAAAPLVERGALRVLERRSRDELAVFHAAADVLVSPRRGGGNAPLKLFDYLAARRPIVATDTPSHRAVLSPERALLVAPGPAGLAEGILTLLADGELARRLAAAAGRWAEAHLGWDAFVESVDELYAEVIGGG